MFLAMSLAMISTRQSRGLGKIPFGYAKDVEPPVFPRYSRTFYSEILPLRRTYRLPSWPAPNRGGLGASEIRSESFRLFCFLAVLICLFKYFILCNYCVDSSVTAISANTQLQEHCLSIVICVVPGPTSLESH